MAQYLYMIWEPFFNEPLYEVLSTLLDFSTVFSSVVVDVVKRQEFKTVFSATHALPTVLIYSEPSFVYSLFTLFEVEFSATLTCTLLSELLAFLSVRFFIIWHGERVFLYNPRYAPLGRHLHQPSAALKLTHQRRSPKVCPTPWHRTCISKGHATRPLLPTRTHGG